MPSPKELPKWWKKYTFRLETPSHGLQIYPLMCPSPHRPMCSSNCSHFPHRKACFLPHTWNPRSQRENWNIVLFLPWAYWGTLQVIEAKLGGQELKGRVTSSSICGIWTGSHQGVGRDKLPGRRGGDQRLKIPELCSVSLLRRICMEAHSLHPPISAPYLISRGVLKVRNPISFSSGILQPPPPSHSTPTHTHPDLLHSLNSPSNLRVLAKKPGKERGN